MSAWVSLFKKEFRHGLPILLSSLIGFLVLLALAAIFGIRGGHAKEAILGTAFIFIFPHVLYLAFYMIISLQLERKKLHLWLSNPMPGYSLLLAKFLNGLIAMTVTLFLACAITLITFLALDIHAFLDGQIIWSAAIRIGLLTILNVYLIAIDIAVWFVFIWMFYRMLVRRLGVFASSIITILFVGVIGYLDMFLESTSFYTTLTHWGEVPMRSFISGFSLSTEDGFQPAIDNFHYFIGTYFLEAIVVIIIYFITSWLLDRKVEV